MSFGKRLRDFALGFGALAATGAAAYESKRGTDEGGEAMHTESRVNKEVKDKTESEVDMWNTEEGQKMRKMLQREDFAKTKQAAEMVKKSNRSLEKVFTTKSSGNPDVKAVQEKVRAQTLKDAMNNFDLVVLQGEADDFLNLMVENATTQELKDCLNNASFKGAFQKHMKAERERLLDLKENPPTDHSGKLEKDPDVLVEYNGDIRLLQEQMKKMQSVLPSAGKVKK